METPTKHSKIENFKGKGNTKGFSKENQPSGKAKSEGWSKKRTLKEIMKMEVAGIVSEARRTEILTYLGLPADSEITIEQMLHMKQIMLSLKSNKGESTAAYRAVNDRAFGQPKQEVEHTGIKFKVTATKK